MTHTQPQQLLTQTHRVSQNHSRLETCLETYVAATVPTTGSSAKQPMTTDASHSASQRNSRWQFVQRALKSIILPSIITLSTLLVPQTQARDLSISVQGQIQPGVYGQLQLGQPSVTVYQQPVYAQPVYQQRVYAQPVYHPQTVIVQPILVQASKKHRKNWKKYCHHYGACQQQVQFVEVGYAPRTRYEKVYVYNEHDHHPRQEKRHYHQDRN